MGQSPISLPSGPTQWLVQRPPVQPPAMAPCRSALEAGIRQPVIHQVTDAVHRVLEEGGGCEHEHPDGWIDEGDDVEGGNESGEFPDVGEVFERFHDGSGLVST